MDLGLGERHREPQNVPALVGPYSDGREHCNIAHNAVMAGFFVARIQDQVFHQLKGPVAPGGEFFIEQPGGPADLRRGQAPELAHYILPRGNTLDVHLGYGQHDGARRSLAAFKRLGIERVVPVTGRLWHLNGNRGVSIRL